MNWIGTVATSEFLWGVVLGVALSIITAVASNHLVSRERRKGVGSFFLDLVASTSDLVREMEDNRDRNKVIDHQFLELIKFDIGCYGRNREHLINIRDQELRKRVNAFFVRASSVLAKVEGNLTRYYENTRVADAATTGSDEQEKLRAAATTHLLEAHSSCDRLRELCNNERPYLAGKLDRLSREGA